MKRDRRLWRFAKLRQAKYLNSIVEQDHRRIKPLVRPGLGSKKFRTAWRTLVGHETLAMMRKGQVKGIGGDDIVAQAAFVNALFNVAAWEKHKATAILPPSEFCNRTLLEDRPLPKPEAPRRRGRPPKSLKSDSPQD